MIPTLNVAQCRARGMLAGAFDFEYPPESDLLDIPFVSFKGPAKVHLEYAIAEDDTVEVEGEISFVLEGACSRCLEPTENAVSDRFSGVFVRGEGDGETYGYRNFVIDFGELLRDAALFALPSRVLCEHCGEE